MRWHKLSINVYHQTTHSFEPILKHLHQLYTPCEPLTSLYFNFYNKNTVSSVFLYLFMYHVTYVHNIQRYTVYTLYRYTIYNIYTYKY